jgi:hypothetical protein
MELKPSVRRYDRLKLLTACVSGRIIRHRLTFQPQFASHRLLEFEHELLRFTIDQHFLTASATSKSGSGDKALASAIRHGSTSFLMPCSGSADCGARLTYFGLHPLISMWRHFCLGVLACDGHTEDNQHVLDMQSNFALLSCRPGFAPVDLLSHPVVLQCFRFVL